MVFASEATDRVPVRGCSDPLNEVKVVAGHDAAWMLRSLTRDRTSRDEVAGAPTDQSRLHLP